MPASNDNTILDTIRRDSETGFRMLVRCYREPVYWHIRRITVLHHDAEDAMQETFLRVFRNIGKFNRDMPSPHGFSASPPTKPSVSAKRTRLRISLSTTPRLPTATPPTNTSTIPTSKPSGSSRQSSHCPRASSSHSICGITTISTTAQSRRSPTPPPRP